MLDAALYALFAGAAGLAMYSLVGDARTAYRRWRHLERERAAAAVDAEQCPVCYDTGAVCQWCVARYTKW